jgi:hypothetical protein
LRFNLPQPGVSIIRAAPHRRRRCACRAPRGSRRCGLSASFRSDTAILGGAALTKQGLLWQPLELAALIAWVVGATLFTGDVSARAFIGHRLFPMAAPTGGTILIAAWLALAIAALAGAFQRG